jgi:hypothetical protein
MRKSLLFLVLTLVSPGITLLQAVNATQDTSQGLSQIFEWLQKMLLSRARHVKTLPNGLRLETVLERVRFDDCTLSYSDVTYSQVRDRRTEEQVFSFEVGLKEVDPARIRIEKEQGYAKLIFNTIGDRNTIKGTMRWRLWSDTAGTQVVEESAKQSRVVIELESYESAEQVGKYFQEAIKECQSSRAP